MTEYEIEYTDYDENGAYYGLDENAPFRGITVDEAGGTVTIHEGGETNFEQAMIDLLAIERDRLLGYPSYELHMHPRDAVKKAWTELADHGHNPDELILPEDQETLDL